MSQEEQAEVDAIAEDLCRDPEFLKEVVDKLEWKVAWHISWRIGVLWLFILTIALCLLGCRSTVPIAHNTEAEAQEDAEVITRWLTTNRQFNVME